MAVIRSPRRSAGRSRLTLAALVAAVALAGCHAGQQAQTAEQRPTIDGTFAQAGSLALRDIVIEYPEGGRWAQGADARLRMIVVNEGREADSLVEVRTDAAEEVRFTASGPPTEEEGTASPTPEPTETGTPTGTPTETGTPTGTATGTPSGTPSGAAEPTASPTEEAPTSIPIPAASLVAFRDAGPAIMLTGLTRSLLPAEVVQVTFVFEQAGEVTVNVAVAVPDEQVSLAPTVPAEGEAEAGA